MNTIFGPLPEGLETKLDEGYLVNKAGIWSNTGPMSNMAYMQTISNRKVLRHYAQLASSICIKAKVQQSN